MNQPIFVNLTQPHAVAEPINDAVGERMKQITNLNPDASVVIHTVMVEREKDRLGVTIYNIPEGDLLHLITFGVGSVQSRTTVTMDGGKEANFRAEYQLIVDPKDTELGNQLLAQFVAFAQEQGQAFPPGAVIGGVSIPGTDINGFLLIESTIGEEPAHPVIVSNPDMLIFHLRLIPLRDREVVAYNEDTAVDIRAALAAHAKKENAWSLTDRPDILWK